MEIFFENSACCSRGSGDKKNGLYEIIIHITLFLIIDIYQDEVKVSVFNFYKRNQFQNQICNLHIKLLKNY